MPREGRLERDAGRLRVADLADEDDVRVLTEDRAEPDGEGEAGAGEICPWVRALISTSIGSSSVMTFTRFVSMSDMHE